MPELNDILNELGLNDNPGITKVAYSTLVNLAKIAVWQNDLDLNALTAEQNGQLEKIGGLLGLITVEENAQPIRLMAENLTKRLVKEGHIEAEQVMDSYNELCEKTAEELEITNKALDFNLTKGFSLGRVSDDQDDGSAIYTAKDRFNNYLRS